MSRGDNLRPLDILDAANEIAAIVASGRGAFLNNAVSQPAVERLLEIIGEAANLVSEDVKDSVFPRWNVDITNLRILLAHHYFRVDVEQVWVMASQSVPELVVQLQSN